LPEQENHNEDSGARRNFWEWQDWLDKETERLKEKKGRIIDPTAPQAKAEPEAEYTPPAQGVRPADHYAKVISSAFPEAGVVDEHPDVEDQPVKSEAAEIVDEAAEAVATEAPAEDPRGSKFDKHLDELFAADRVINIPGKREFRHNTDHLEKKKISRKKGNRSHRLNAALGPLALLSWLTEMMIQSNK